MKWNFLRSKYNTLLFYRVSHIHRVFCVPWNTAYNSVYDLNNKLFMSVTPVPLIYEKKESLDAY